MKRYLFISLLILTSLSVYAQKVSIQVIITKNAGLTDWQILDDQKQSVFQGIGYLQQDTVSFSLDADRHYSLKLSVAENAAADTHLLTLVLNNEPLLYIKSYIGAGDHLIPFFTGVRTPVAKITGGTNTLISDFPWQVYYISGNFRCGGSIISNRWILTAAHCTKNSTGGAIAASDMFVRVDVNNPANAAEGHTYAVSQAIVNEGFNDQTLLNDIALLRLTDTINFVNAKPIKLISADDVAQGAIDPGVMATITGWGLTHVSPNVLPTTLQKVQLPVVTLAQAETVWGNTIPVTDIMAGFLNGNKDACNGDSGGPFAVPVLDEFKIAGIVSWGSANCNTYGAYTRVSDFLSWIQTNTGITSGFKPHAPEGDSIICQGTVSTAYSIPVVTGATAYEWKILPANAGVITGNSRSASVIWNVSYTGPVNIIVRVNLNNKLSDWGRLNANLVVNTELLNQSRDTIMCAGQPITLKVNAIGYNLHYSWFKNSQAVPTNSAPTLTILTTKADDSGVYKCVIDGSCGSVTSNNINLTVYPVTAVTKIPPATEVAFGGDVTLNVTAVGHDLTYQWQKDSSVIANSNTPSLFLHNLNAGDIGIYRVRVNGTCGTTTSDTIYLYVKRTDLVSDPQVFVWPSMTNSEFSVALNNDAFYNIRIFNSSGEKVREQLNCRYQTRINISHLAKGIYVVEVYNSGFKKSLKVIKD